MRPLETGKEDMRDATMGIMKGHCGQRDSGLNMDSEYEVYGSGADYYYFFFFLSLFSHL